MTHYSEIASPLIGCLFCHTEGTITEHHPQRFVNVVPKLLCSHCGSVALFEVIGEDSWQIKYTHTSDDQQYHYAKLRFKGDNWLKEEDAIDISREVYIQRHRVGQAQAGKLGWLKPDISRELPTTLSPEESVLVFIDEVRLQRHVQEEEGQIQHEVDRGALFLSNHRLHVAGKARDWVYEINAIESATFIEKRWMLRFSDQHFIEHHTEGDEHDAQLFVAIIEGLGRQG